MPINFNLEVSFEVYKSGDYKDFDKLLDRCIET